MSLFERILKEYVQTEGVIKSSSYSDVKAIYDSLPEDQKRLVSPRGKFVDSPNLQLRVLNKDKTGFAEAYKLKGGPKDSAFVTLAVHPDAQGKGAGKELLQQLVARAKEEKIKKLVYRLASENSASRALVKKFVDAPSKVGKDFEEYTIDPANVKDPAKLRPFITASLTSRSASWTEGPSM